jgi:hypothetical protein
MSKFEDKTLDALYKDDIDISTDEGKRKKILQLAMTVQSLTGHLRLLSTTIHLLGSFVGEQIPKTTGLETLEELDKEMIKTITEIKS